MFMTVSFVSLIALQRYWSTPYQWRYSEPFGLIAEGGCHLGQDMVV